MLEAADIRYEDLVAAADVVVSKPGYGIVSECIANQTALLYTSRGVFAENDVLIAGMKPVVRSRFISQDDLRSGLWEPSIRALLAEPEPRGTDADRWCQRRRVGNPRHAQSSNGDTRHETTNEHLDPFRDDVFP